MSDKDLQRYRHYESMIKKARKTGIGEKPPSCAKCQYYQPDFKYRKCLYARCPYQRDAEIFRKARLSLRLTEPYSEARKQAAREQAKAQGLGGKTAD